MLSNTTLPDITVVEEKIIYTLEALLGYDFLISMIVL